MTLPGFPILNVKLHHGDILFLHVFIVEHDRVDINIYNHLFAVLIAKSAIY